MFPRAMSFSYNTKEVKRSYALSTSKRSRNEVKATSLSKFGRTFLKDFVEFDQDFEFIRPPLRRRIVVYSTIHFSLGNVFQMGINVQNSTS